MCKIVTYVEQCIRRTVPIRQPRMSNSAYVGQFLLDSHICQTVHMLNTYMCQIVHLIESYTCQTMHMSGILHLRMLDIYICQTVCMLDCLRQTIDQGSLLQVKYGLGIMSNRPQAQYALQFHV